MPFDFKKLMLTRFLYTFAVQMQAVLIGWQIYELLQDPLALGFVGLAEAVPALGLALFAGNIVDHGRPLIIYRRVIFVSLASAIIVLISQSPEVSLDPFSRALALYLASFLTGTVRAFSQPSIFATVPRIVPRDKLTQSSAWMSSSMQIARIGGPAIGGLVFGYFGATVASACVCVGLILGFLVISSMQNLGLDVRHEKKPSEGVRDGFYSGLKYVFSHPILLPALSLDMISVLFGGVTALLPIYAKEILFVGPKGLGVLRAAPAVGAAIMSIILIRINLRARAGHWLFFGVFAFGVSTLVFAISQDFIISLGALFLSGAFDSISMVIRTAAVQMESPDHMRGRISAVNSIFIGSSNELGELESGIAARLLGTVPSAIFGASMCILTVIAVALGSKRLRNYSLPR